MNGGGEAVIGIGAMLVVILAILIGVVLLIGLGWVLPIWLGVSLAKKKGYNPLWMLFGIHPIGGWIAVIVFACLPPRLQCPGCGGFVTPNFRVCPFCRRDLAAPTPQP